MTAEGLCEARLGRLRDALAAHVERGEVSGAVALVARGEAVQVEAVGLRDLATGAAMTRDSLFRIASMTKAVTAAAALCLIEEARLGLDEPLERWLPELAGRRVLRAPDARLDDTVPARRAITLRDLLTLRLGLGAIMAPPGSLPIQLAMAEAGVAPGPDPIPFPPDDYMARVGRLPLVDQPGERWLYHTGFDILCVLLERVAGRPLQDLLAERIFTPLGMKDSGFQVPEAALDRLSTCYRRGPDGGLEVYDGARDGLWSRPPGFGTELVSTAGDFLAFARMLLNRGRHRRARVLAPSSVELMTSDQITRAQKDRSPFFPGFWETTGWGFGVGVVTRPSGIPASAGAFGWDGGFGTSFVVDPGRDLVAILMIQRLMTGPDDTELKRDFLTLAYQAIGV